jgi:hypothetical protein
MTSIDTFLAVTAQVTDVKGPPPGVSLTFKQPSSTITAGVDSSFKNPTLSATLNLNSAAVGLTGAESDVTPNFRDFNAALKISALKDNQLEFGIRRLSPKTGSALSLSYKFADQSVGVTVDPKFTIPGIGNFSGHAALATAAAPVASGGLEIWHGVTVRAVYSTKVDAGNPFRLAAFWAGKSLTLGASAGFGAVGLPGQVSLFTKGQIAKLIEFSTVTNIATVDRATTVEVRAETAPCEWPIINHGTRIGVVVRRDPGKGISWRVGAKGCCKRTGASLALEYTPAKAAIAVLALPECGNCKGKATFSARWKTLELSSALLKPSVGVELALTE